MSHNVCKSVALAAASLSFTFSVGSVSAQAAETFFVQEGVALNTNNNFGRIDGTPRMSIYRRNDNDPDQQFDRLPGNRGGILLKHRSTGKCLNAHYLTNGSQINVWSCDANDPDQNWNIVGVGNNFNLIKRTGTNLCIDTPTRDNQGKVYLWNCDGNNGNQRWKSSISIDQASNGAEAFFKWAQGQRYIARLDTANYKGECVSLIARYIAEVFFPANQRTQTVYLDNGGGVANKVATNYKQYFEPLTNQGLPKRGAVISFPSITLPYGHVAIVMAVQQLPNGQRQVKIMDSGLSQNAGYVKEQTWWINIPDGRAQGYGTGIVWTNPR
ncbi:RICIN domain-containing protein [Nostoc sp.]|uniref:RICIN domain-containing protein n=1 Tax=Nostoc sp. TaxID=1180 RepID=UPI002FF5BF8C